LITTLDDIAWVLNLRGDDIQFNPLFFSYLIFHKKTDSEPNRCDLFIDQSKITP
jgi:Xaa-Pro aminopeptidase